MSLGNQYTKFTPVKTASYTITVSDDIAIFNLSAPGTATLPFSKDCTIVSGQNQKLIINKATSADLTVAVQSGDTLVGVATLQAGYQTFVEGNQIKTWNSVGGSGVSGTSGFSGYSGASGFSGYSGKSGFSGFTGISGASGTSGYSGYTGFSGYSGISGFSGYSAFSGYSGASGFSGFTGF